MPSPLNRYSFINAKLKTRMDFLLKENFFHKLEDRPNLNEAMLMLKSTPYGMMETVYEQTGDLKMAEKELREKEISFYKELKRHTDDLLSGFLDILQLKFDIEILKDWIRIWFDSRIRKRDISALTPYMIRIRVLTDIDPESLLACSNEEELYTYLCTMDLYKEVFETYLKRQVALNRLYDLERDLDRLRFRRILKYSELFPEPDKSIIRNITGMEIDFENMLHMVRMAGTLPPEKILTEMITGGKSSVSAKDAGISSVSAESKGLSEKKFLERTLSSYGSMGTLLLSDGSNPSQKMEMMEAVFTEIEKKESEKLLRGSPFNIGIMLIYFIRKGRECQRLVSLLNAGQYKSQSMGTGGKS
jgi:V/A-type H+/Na+-transporting ATPase subunit C